jgi:hypothetical protein
MTPATVTAGLADTFDVACWLVGFCVIVSAPLWWHLARDSWRHRRAMRVEVKWPI